MIVTTIGVLALQGDFLEHSSMLRRLRVEPREVRTAAALNGLDGLIIPGGESTTFCRLMADFSLYEPLRSFVRAGVPVWGTCAGMIVLARDATGLPFPTLNAIDIAVERNAYGRQLESFEADIDVPAFGEPSFHAVFIRAPRVESIGPGVEVLASCTGANGGPAVPVAVRQAHVIATSFHPELTGDPRFHEYFAQMTRTARTAAAK
jgi:5'-phosphate synthase pdxT subunit